jgi:uncharacterized protein
MKILLTGSHGLVGSALRPLLRAQGHDVLALIRDRPVEPRREARWDPATGFIDAQALEGLDAVVHLAGENLAGGRWTASRKAAIRDSRVLGTRLLSQTLAAAAQPPRVLISASAIGYYGDRGEEVLTEATLPGTGFLSQVCQEWEEATGPAAARGIGVVLLRFGVILSRTGGALTKMLPLFRLGLGGRLGHGRQFWSWIHIDDVAATILHAVQEQTLSGPVNVVSPQPVTNAEFTRTLAAVLGRPAVLPAPAFALKLALGEMADAALLSSARVLPEKLQRSGFRYRFPDLRGALEQLLQ